MSELAKSFAYAATHSETAKHKNHLYLVLTEGRICTNDAQRTQGETERKAMHCFLVYELTEKWFLVLFSLCLCAKWICETHNS